MARRGNDNGGALDKGRVLAYLAEKPHATKRDLAQALHIKGSDRIALKRILKELESEGVIDRGRKKTYAEHGAPPSVAVLVVAGQDTDGELLARLESGPGDDSAPPIPLVLSRDVKDPPGIGDRVLAKMETGADGAFARVLKTLAPGAERVLGVYQRTETGGRVAAIDKKSRAEFIVEQRDRAGAENNELVLAELMPGRAHGAKRARILERLGSLDEPRSVSLIAIHAHGIPNAFPPEVVREAEAAGPAPMAHRTDLRAIPLVTIDPVDARDHDDAVWAAPDDDAANPDGHVVIVAIADVAHYVRPGSGLDTEAYKRGNSVYFPDRVVLMLPEHLSADLCSLKQDVDRPCLAVRMVFDREGNKRAHTFLRGMMRSAARLTYADAQRAFDGHALDRPQAVRDTLAALWNAYQAMTRARGRRDPLDLDLPERRVVIGADGKVASIAFRERLESMRLIEECMVIANVAAAETLEKARTPLVYRVHEQPSKEKLFSFSDYLHTIGQSFAKGQVIKPGTFNRVLAAAKGSPHEAAMNDVVLRTQAQAIYDPANVGHFGLNLDRYAHFTSPIRRYADLVVHRALIRAMKLGDDGLTGGEAERMAEIAGHISMTERRAMAAERDSTDRYVAAFMSDRIGAAFDARITGVTKFGLFARLPETGAEGLIPIRALGFEYFRHDERKHALIGERSGTVYAMGDVIPVTLAEAAPLTGGLRFDLAGAAPARRPGPKNHPRRAGKPGAGFAKKPGGTAKKPKKGGKPRRSGA